MTGARPRGGRVPRPLRRRARSLVGHADTMTRSSFRRGPVHAKYGVNQRDSSNGKSPQHGGLTAPHERCESPLANGVVDLRASTPTSVSITQDAIATLAMRRSNAHDARARWRRREHRRRRARTPRLARLSRDGSACGSSNWTQGAGWSSSGTAWASDHPALQPDGRVLEMARRARRGGGRRGGLSQTRPRKPRRMRPWPRPTVPVGTGGSGDERPRGPH